MALASSLGENAALTGITGSTTVADFGLCSAVSGGSNYYIGGALTSSQTFSSAGNLTFAIGAVTLTAS